MYMWMYKCGVLFSKPRYSHLFLIHKKYLNAARCNQKFRFENEFVAKNKHQIKIKTFLAHNHHKWPLSLFHHTNNQMRSHSTCVFNIWFCYMVFSIHFYKMQLYFWVSSKAEFLWIAFSCFNDVWFGFFSSIFLTHFIHAHFFL